MRLAERWRTDRSARGQGAPRRTAVALVVAIVCAGACPSLADDWPQWRGPGRDAISAETGLLSAWPEGGPKLAWHATGLGEGYSSVVVARGQVFTLGRHGADVVVTALNEATGESTWTRKIGATERNCMSTPTWDAGRLYALSPDGALVALDAASGEVLWQKDLVKDFAGRTMSGRGYGESPLIDGDKLVCTPGGEDAAIVALDKRTGALVWKSKLGETGPLGKDGAGFASAVISEAAGVRQYVQLMGRGLVGIDARDGRFLWAYNGISNETANIPTPVVQGDFVFAANGYTAGAVLLALSPDGAPGDPRRGVKADVVYSLRGSQFQNHHGGFVRLGDYLYGGHGNNNGLPTCLEFKTGRVVWKQRGPGVGSAAVVYADGHLVFRYQNGVVALIEASQRGYHLQGTFEIPGAGGDSWSHPVVANGRLYLREQDSLWVHDLRAGKAVAPAAAAIAAEKDEPLAPLAKLGVAVEPLAATSPAPPRTALERPLYAYALVVDEASNRTPTLWVTLTDRQLTRQGTLADELVKLLERLPGRRVLNLAATHFSDAGLAQLEKLDGADRQRIVGLNLELCTRISDDGLKPLASLGGLRALSLAGTAVTHAGLGHLAKNQHLVAVDLEGCDGITDEACQPLAAMRQLKALVFKKSGFEPHRIGNAGLEKLQNLSELEVLNLYGNSVNDEGLASLKGMKKLKELNLSLLDVNDAGLRHLQALGALERLDLLYSTGFAGPTIHDEGAAALAMLGTLTTLDLSGSKLTDAGLNSLATLRKLKSLKVPRTTLSAGAIRTFQAAVPGCEVVR